MNRKIRKAAFLVAGLALFATLSFPQGPQGRPGPGGGYGGPGEGRRGMAFGTIQSVGVNQLMVQKSDGSTVTVKVNDQTRFMDQDKPIQLEDLKAGDHVMVRSRTSDSTGSNGPQTSATNPSTITAAAVRRVPAGAAEMFQGDHAFGRITAINGNQITVQGRQGQRTITVSSETQYMKDGQTASLGDFKVGDPVMAAGKESNGQFVANRLMTRSFGGRRQPGSQSESQP